MKTNIASERVKLGLSQEQLGKYLKLSRDVVSNWESGTTTPKIDVAIKLADTFGCSLDYLFARTEERTVNGDVILSSTHQETIS